jgi:hypothetical protein
MHTCRRQDAVPRFGPAVEARQHAGSMRGVCPDTVGTIGRCRAAAPGRDTAPAGASTCCSSVQRSLLCPGRFSNLVCCSSAFSDHGMLVFMLRRPVVPGHIRWCQHLRSNWSCCLLTPVLQGSQTRQHRYTFQLHLSVMVGSKAAQLCCQAIVLKLERRSRHSRRRLQLACLMRPRSLMPTHEAWRRQWPIWHASLRTDLQVLPLLPLPMAADTASPSPLFTNKRSICVMADKSRQQQICWQLCSSMQEAAWRSQTRA